MTFLSSRVILYRIKIMDIMKNPLLKEDNHIFMIVFIQSLLSKDVNYQIYKTYANMIKKEWKFMKSLLLENIYNMSS